MTEKLLIVAVTLMSTLVVPYTCYLQGGSELRREASKVIKINDYKLCNTCLQMTKKHIELGPGFLKDFRKSMKIVVCDRIVKDPKDCASKTDKWYEAALRKDINGACVAFEMCPNVIVSETDEGETLDDDEEWRPTVAKSDSFISSYDDFAQDGYYL